jgi:hypothetical protein
MGKPDLNDVKQLHQARGSPHTMSLSLARRLAPISGYEIRAASVSDRFFGGIRERRKGWFGLWVRKKQRSVQLRENLKSNRRRPQSLDTRVNLVANIGLLPWSATQ